MGKPLQYHFEPMKRDTFKVSVKQPTGEFKPVGTVKHFYIRHMECYGWEATGADGHLAVHEHRWQAAWALTWDRTGYPFPLPASREREVLMVG